MSVMPMFIQMSLSRHSHVSLCMFPFLNLHIFFHRSFKILHNCPSHKTTSMSRSTQVCCEDRVRGTETHSAMEGLMLVLLSFFCSES
jgi:hypothetical protein